MSLPDTNGVLIHKGYNCSPNVVPTAQSIQMSPSDNTTVNSAVSNKMDKANPVGTGSLSLNRASGSTLGPKAVATGDSCTASGNQSHAEGYQTIASGNTSHSEGYQTTASGNYSHAEGYVTTSSGYYSHSEGFNTTASGYQSHAEGYGNEAKYSCQHVFGMYSDPDVKAGAQASDKGNYIEIVGKGTGNSSRSNARTLDWNGNEVLAGGLKVNGTKDVAVQSDFTPTAGALTSYHANFSGGGYSLTRSGKIVVFSFYMGITGSIAGNVELATLPSGFIPYADTRLYANTVYNGNPFAGSVTASTDGKIYASFGSNNMTAALTITGTYICS